MRLAQVTTTLLAMASLAFFAGCSRPAKDDAAISFDLPKFVKSEKSLGKVSAMEASDLKLNHVVINASASDMESLFKAWESCHDGCTNPELTGPFEFSVKSGSNRLVQLLAVYQSASTGETSFRYGDISADLNGGTVTLAIPVTPIATGPVAQSQISGRYFTSTNAGPTGNVDIKYNPGGGKPKLIVERGEIVNGWFSLFGLAGVKLEYTVRESGLVLWGEPVDALSEQMDPAANAASNFSRLVRAYMPVHLRQEYGPGNTTYWSPEDAGIYVWGYWGHGGDAMLVAGKFVCTQGLTGGSFTRMKQFAMTPGDPLSITRSSDITTTYPTIASLVDTVSPLTDVFVHGGGTSDMSADCNGVSDAPANLFANFQKVNLTKMDGNGKDSLAGFRGVFVIDPANGSLASVTGTPSVITGQLLPGTNALFPGMRAFKRVAPNQGYVERVSCQALPAGYVSAGSDSTTTGDSFTLNTNISAADKAAGVSAILCPLVSTMVPAAAGGAYLDTWNFPGTPPGPPLANTFIVISPQDSTTTGAIANGVCTPFTVRGTLSGSPAQIPKNTMISLNADPSVSFYGDASCSGPSLGGYSHTGGSEAQLFVLRNTAGTTTYTMNAYASGFTGASSSWSFNDTPGSPNFSLRVKWPAPIHAHECYPITYEAWHDDSTPASFIMPFDQSYFYNLLNITGINYFSDSDCTAGIGTTLTMNPTDLVKRFYFKYTDTSASINLTPTPTASPVTAVSAPGPTTVIQPGPASKLLVEMPQTIPADDCTRVRIRRTDSAGNSAPGGAITVNLGGTNAVWYTSSSCSMTMSTANIAAGDSQIIRYFRAPVVGTAIATVTDATTSLTAANAPLTVGPASFTKVMLLYSSQGGNPMNPPPTAILTNINDYVDVILVTQSGAVSTGINGSLNVSFMSNNLGRSPSSPMLSFTNGVATMTVSAPTAGSFNASISVQREDGFSITSTPSLSGTAKPTATQLTMYVEDPLDLVAGGCQVVMVVPEDSLGAASLNATFTLSADNGAAFYADSGCTSAVSGTQTIFGDDIFKVYFLKTPSSGALNVGVMRVGGMAFSPFNGGWSVQAGSVSTASQFLITGRPGTAPIKSNRCQPYLVSVADANGRSVLSAGNSFTASPTSMGGVAGSLYGTCAYGALPTSIPSGGIDYAVVYLRDMDTGGAATTRIGVSGGLAGSTHDVQSNP